MKERLTQKAINFDLDTNKMKEQFTDYTKGYHLLEKFFTRCNFDHEQGSGYISKEKISCIEIEEIIEKVIEENPWLPECCKKFRITEPTVIYQGEFLLDKIATLDKKNLKEEFVKINPLRVYQETDKTVLVKIDNSMHLNGKTLLWLPKDKVSIDKEGMVYAVENKLVQGNKLLKLNDMKMSVKFNE
jgi:virulence-associated protein VapD